MLLCRINECAKPHDTVKKKKKRKRNEEKNEYTNEEKAHLVAILMTLPGVEK